MSAIQNLVCFASLAGAFLLITGRACVMQSVQSLGLQHVPEFMVTMSCLYSIFTVQKGKVVDEESKNEMCKNRMIAGLITFAVCLTMPLLQSISECIAGQVGEYLPEVLVTSAVTFWLYKVRARPIRMGTTTTNKTITPPPSPKLKPPSPTPAPKCLSEPQVVDTPPSAKVPAADEAKLASSKTPDSPQKKKFSAQPNMVVFLPMSPDPNRELSGTSQLFWARSTNGILLHRMSSSFLTFSRKESF